MNREERRKLEKTNNKMSVMGQYRKEAYDEGYARGMQDVVDITFYMVAYTLSYAIEDISKEKLQEICKRIFNNIDAYRTGHLTPKDYDEIVRMLEEEYEIKLR